MVMVASDTDEALIAAARQMTQAARTRSERVCYYRTPNHTPAGEPHLQAGWVTWGDTQDSIKWSKIARGYIPLEQYGHIRTKRREDDPDGPFELYGHWGPLLANPAGLRELPPAQIMAYHWYDALRLSRSLRNQIPPTLRARDGMVLWPQLAGMDLRIFACPECADWRALEAVYLARHLRVWHDYDRADIIAFGQQYGIDFTTEINREGRVIRSFSFDNVEEDMGPAPEEEVPGFSLDVARPARSRRREP